MPHRDEKLSAYIRAAASRQFDWGAHDCCTFPGDWVIACRGDDPVERWRGSYASQDEALELIDDAGGLATLWDIGLRAIGIHPCDGAPLPGDVGLVAVSGEHGPAVHGGICTGRRWTFLGTQGVITFSAVPFVFWRP